MMSLPTIPRRAIALTAWLAVGCSSPVVQYAYVNAPFAVEVREGRPAEVQLEGGSVLRFARVRLVGDTLYGWDFAAGSGREDSVAVPVRRLRAVQQEHFDVAASLNTVVFSAMAVFVAFLALVVTCQHTACIE